MAINFAQTFKLFMTSIFVLALAGCELLEGPIEQSVLNQAIANYSGLCACPFSLDIAGNLCGDQSAYSQGAADATICYISEVTFDMITQYLASN